MTVKFKDGVNPHGVRLETIRLIVEASHVYIGFGKPHVTVTSINDGKHSRSSRHYMGYAVDFRTRDDNDWQQWPEAEKQQIAQALRNRLGSDYDIVVEGTHLHCEFDPKP